jgi:kynurenine formamidase
MNKKHKPIDLTHTLHSGIPAWDDSCGFELSIKTDYKDCTPPDLFRTQKINSNTGMGTHMDAPAHVVPDHTTIDNIALENLVTECFIIDVSKVADENYIITPSVIEDFELRNGRITENSFVIFYTGWDKYWGTPEKYRNNYKFPTIHEDTASLLLKRNISGLGTDTLSADNGSNGFPVHRKILGAGKYLVENIVNAEQVPPTGAKIIIAPIKIKDGTEAPIRLIALV